MAPNDAGRPAADGPVRLDDVERCVDVILDRVGKHVRLALPLGIGKAVSIANALYQRAARDPGIELDIFTGLTLDRPRPKSELERRLLEPMADRLFGSAPPLAYSEALARGRLPDNVRVSEFFFQPGFRLGHARAQQDYIGSNYTHVARDAVARGINVIAQLVAPPEDGGTDRYSLSSNTDITLDILPVLERQRARGEPFLFVAEVNANLPYFGGEAELDASRFDVVHEPTAPPFEPFSVPHERVAPATYAAALHAARLVRDGGTLQIGIGAFADALAAVLLMRHQEPDRFGAALTALDETADLDTLGPFETGLYGSSEMLVSGFLALMEAGVLKREVYDHPALQLLANHGRLPREVTPDLIDRLLAARLLSPRPGAGDVARLRRHGIVRDDVRFDGERFELPDGAVVPATLDDPAARRRFDTHCLGTRVRGGTVLHAGFFVGSRAFYRRLREMPAAARAGIRMTGIHYINDLAGDETLKRLQRRRATFVNQAMMVTLLGAVVSDALDDGRVVSGVGGQYNFVAQAHALEEGRSVIVVPATRMSGGRRVSNIVPAYGNTTIPRHLRDVVVTEYGIADLRGRTDAECIAAMIAIADAAFQDELLAWARDHGKIDPEFRIPDAWRQNTPSRIADVIAAQAGDGRFDSYPFGSELEAEERELAAALGSLKGQVGSLRGRLAVAWRALAHGGATPDQRKSLERMGLWRPRGLRNRFYRRLVASALKARQ